MITHLRGTVSAQKDDGLVIDVGGVGYKVACPRQTLAKAETVGETVCIFTELLIREDGWFLYGFSEEAEREAFRTLLSVQGIGPKAALMLLSTLGVERLGTALLHQDTEMLCQAEGVGPKLARRLINELKDKTTFINALPSTKGLQAKDVLSQDVSSALLNLGYKRIDVGEVVQHVRADMSGQEVSFDMLFRESLKRLSALS